MKLLPLLIFLVSCAPSMILSSEPMKTDCYLNAACLPRVWGKVYSDSP